MKTTLTKVLLIALLSVFGTGNILAQSSQGLPGKKKTGNTTQQAKPTKPSNRTKAAKPPKQDKSSEESYGSQRSNTYGSHRFNTLIPLEPSKPKAPSNVYINGHEAVDLGLPSGLKWATCNIGASSPEDYGDYFAWGELSPDPTASYELDNCKTFNKKMGDISGNPAYDAARTNWGGSWRIPTAQEYLELKENCSTEWTTRDGVYGLKFISKKNDNSIFLPAAGWCGNGTIDIAEEFGRYWSSTPVSDSWNAHNVRIFSGGAEESSSGRDIGLPVRPVSE